MKAVSLSKDHIHSGNLILINAQNPLSQQHKAELMPADENHLNVLIERNAATMLSHILRHISCTDEIVPVSGYRSKKEQQQIYESSLKENGQAFTNKYVALPQCSEHQTGYAIDLALKKDEIDFICPDFPYSGICNEFRRAAPKYGLIQRYEKGKEKITGIAHEPWHFRYVGYPHSEIISSRNFSLEEYIDFIKAYTINTSPLKVPCGKTQAEIFYTKAAEEATTIEFEPSYLYQISGNNVDGFITTLWRQ